jgi:hypothetical protein
MAVKTHDNDWWTAFAGCLFVCTGLGVAFGNMFAGLLFGLGAGFLALAALKYYGK